jgi:leucyl-tRNA synthetase
MKRYDPKSIEPKWQARWADDKVYEAVDGAQKPKIYATPMLPYPSGSAMHTGHVRNYAIADVVARFYRQKGYNTLHTMAWDAFGLPAENYAIKTGTPPAVSTAQNTVYFKKQLQALAMSYDWSREFTTSDPSYYKWTQWVFGLMYSRGLAYKAEKAQWWCEKCNTVLADEQVDASGKCWRHDSPEDDKVTKRDVSQWFLKITEYADQILDATDDLDWPDKIKAMQKNWIGRSRGALIKFALQNEERGTRNEAKFLEVFTTRADTIFSGAFIVLAPEHKLVAQLTTDEHKAEIEDYIKTASKKSELERQENKGKTGVFTGSYAINPANDKKIPIWIGDFVLASYGTGAVFGDIHDERDFEFLKKYDIPAEVTVVPEDKQEAERVLNKEYPYVNEGILIKSEQFSGMRSEIARDKIIEWLAQKGLAEEKVNYRIRDWLISRQRYWGAPVPIIYCPDHGAVLVPESDLPVELPEVANYVPDGNNSSVLAGVESWVNAPCPTCGKMGKRETDTMDGYVCSTWYLHRYTDPHNTEKAFDSEKANYWFPLDFYFGADHAVAHLLYIRFFQRVLVDAGLMDKKTIEPVKKLVYNGYINAENGAKMSKSKGNTVDPMDIIEQGYGADALRVFELFIAPYDQDTSWNTNGVPGTYRFLQRYWTLVQEFLDAKNLQESGVRSQESREALSTINHKPSTLLASAHKTIKKVSHDLQNLSFNTAVSAMMECVNELYKIKATDGFAAEESWEFALKSLTQLLAPFAPHITEELWHELGETDSVHVDHWPVFEDKYLVSDTMTIVVQVNGKVRAQLLVSSDSDEHNIRSLALAEPNVAKFLGGKEPSKVIYVAKKLISIVP